MAQSSQPPQRRLGRGLSALISPNLTKPGETENPTPLPPAQPLDEVTPASGRSVMVAVDQVRPNPHQPRRHMDENRLRELSESIASSGIIQPIIVRSVADGYELIAGERRLRAAKLAGLEAIPAIVRQVDSDLQAQMALIENIQREDLNPVERAEAYQKLIGQLGLSQGELAGRLGEDRTNISHYLRLLELPSPVQQAVADGKLTMGHAKLLGGVGSPEEQERLAALAISQSLTVRNLERIIAERPTVRKPGPTNKSPYVRDLEKQLTSKLGMRVQVDRRAQGKGKLVIYYTSLDEFDTLMERMNVEVE